MTALRMLFVFCAYTVWLGLAGRTWAAQAPGKRFNLPVERPNVVLILADDVGREVLGCYGGTSYKTPHIDALARTGRRFSHCYSMPVCHPSRIALMTGRYPFRNPAPWGSWPKGAQTFAQMLQKAGYATAVAGKWQLALLRANPDHASELGFDQSALFGWHEGPRYHNPLIYRNGRVWQEVRRPEVFGPQLYTQFLIDFMEQHRRQPFLAYYSMALCHEISDDFSPVPPPAPDGHYLSYAEMVEQMDQMVGRIVSAVDRLGLRRRTLILFTTDNGSPGKYLTGIERIGGKARRRHAPVVSVMNGREIAGGKGRMTDAGTRVPLIANWPGVIEPGTECDALIDFTDFLPTLAEVCGAPLPEGVELDGESFLPQLLDPKAAGREWVFCEHKGRYWVRNQRWKLYNDGKFYDMANDPDERHPLGTDELSAEAAAARKLLADALHSLGIALAEPKKAAKGQ